jgi:hypothetical protein
MKQPHKIFKMTFKAFCHTYFINADNLTEHYKEMVFDQYIHKFTDNYEAIDKMLADMKQKSNIDASDIAKELFPILFGNKSDQ